MMRAAQLVAQGAPLELREVPVPEPGPGEVLVRLEASGICHTDLHIRDGDEEIAAEVLPLTLGHEGIGRVAALGAGVTTLKEGDRIGVPWTHDTCECCRDCLTGHESVCTGQRVHGYSVPGAYADYVLVQARFAVAIPEGLAPIEAAPLLCAGVTALTAIRKAALEPGMRAAIFGCGGLGQYAVQFARLHGAEVVAVDTDTRRLAAARCLGAAQCIEAGPETGAELVALGGMDACLNFAPTPHVLPAIIEGLVTRGRFVQVSMPPEPASLPLTWLTMRTPVLTGTSVGGRQELADTLALAARHDIAIPVEPVTLEEANHALDRLAGRPGTEPVEGRLVIDLAAA